MKPDDAELSASFEDMYVDGTFRANSQQWRLQQPNNSSDRPNGMAPIIPQMDPYDPIERPRDYSSFKHFRNGNYNNNGRNNNNNYNNNGRNNNNNRRNNNQNNFNRNNNFNNNRINRPNQNNIPRNDNFIKDQIRNISFNNRNPNNNNFTVTSKLSLTSPSAQLAEAQNLISKTNVNKGDLGTIASAMMAILGNAAVPATPIQKYNMEVQKKIHDIQVRSLKYLFRM